LLPQALPDALAAYHPADGETCEAELNARRLVQAEAELGASRGFLGRTQLRQRVTARHVLTDCDGPDVNTGAVGAKRAAMARPDSD
jgi:hypothetical protein